MVEHDRKYGPEFDTDPGAWNGEDDCPTEVDPQTETQRVEERRQVVEFFDRFLRSLDVRRLRERRARELVSARTSGGRDFVAYVAAAAFPPSGAKGVRLDPPKVALAPEATDRTAPTVVLRSRRPIRWGWGALVMAAATAVVCSLGARARTVSLAPPIVSAEAPTGATPSVDPEPLAAAPVENSAELTAERPTAAVKAEKPWPRKPDPRAPATPARKLAAPEGPPSSTPTGPDPMAERIVPW
jgi:hypothetical protein